MNNIPIFQIEALSKADSFHLSKISYLERTSALYISLHCSKPAAITYSMHIFIKIAHYPRAYANWNFYFVFIFAYLIMYPAQFLFRHILLSKIILDLPRQAANFPMEISSMSEIL